jgi:hypothetical protein
VIVNFVDIGGIVDHHCLGSILHLVDIGGIIFHRCLDVIVHLLILVELLIITTQR